MAQQTALEFLLSELDIVKLIEREKLIMAAEVVRQAKAIEKEHLISAWEDGSESEYQYHVNGEYRKCSHDYYNQTYKK